MEQATDFLVGILAYVEGDAETRHLFDLDGKALAHLNSSNAVLLRYLNGDGATDTYARMNSTGTLDSAWLLSDHLGSVRMVQSLDGYTTLDSIAYDAFGNITSESNPGERGAFAYTGLRTDPATGLVFAHWRAYDPQTGKWMQEDPMGLKAGDPNFRRYVGNEATGMVDPSGLLFESVGDWFGDQLGFGSSQRRKLLEEQKRLGLNPIDKVPNSTLGGALREGLRDGTVIAGNRLTLGQIGNLKRESDRLIKENGGLYATSDSLTGAGAAVLTTVVGGQVIKGGLAVGRAGVSAVFGGDAACAVGTVLGVGATVALPAAVVLQADAIADGVVKTLERIYEGDLNGAIQAIGDLASDTIGIRGALNGLGRLGRAIGGGKQGLQKLWQELQACFAAGTPLLTQDGPKNIEDFKPGDLVLSRDEFDPEGPVEPKVVEEVFRRLGRIFHLHVAGQVIRTTAEHPFFVPGRGWVDAGELRIGDRLLSLDGRTMPVEDLLDTGEHETVYNMRVGEWHTYFVGQDVDIFVLWSHNTPNGLCRINLNNNNSVSTFGIYRIKIDKDVYKFGKADMERVTQSTGLPTRIHQQIRKLRKLYPKKRITHKIVDKLGETTTEAAKAAEKARLQEFFDQTQIVPVGNEKSFFPEIKAL